MNSGFGYRRRKAPVVEQELAEAGALNALQKLLGNDLVGIDVGAIERNDNSGVLRNGCISGTPSGARR